MRLTVEFSIYDIISALKQLCIFNIYTLGLGMLNSVTYLGNGHVAPEGHSHPSRFSNSAWLLRH